MAAVAAGSGWMPLREPPRQGREAFHISPFNRLARVHAAASAGDVMVAVALAGSLFFSIDPTQARWRVGLYLLLTLAPFAVVAPFIGPAIDRFRGGSRWVILLTCVCRAFIALLMTRHLDGLLLFPEAFAMLVFAKGYQVARSAYVPATVRSDTELVRANSRLALVAALAGPAGAVPAGLVHVLLGSHWVVGLSILPFIVGTVLASKLPAPASWSLAHRVGLPDGVQPPPAPEADVPPAEVADEGQAEGGAQPGAVAGEVFGGGRPLGVTAESGPAFAASAPGPDVSRSPDVGRSADGGGPEREAREHGIFLAASTMGLLRGVVGFVTFLLAFSLRTKGGAAGYGLVLGAAGGGNLIGSLVAPKLRELLREDQILTACLAATAVVGFVSGVLGGMTGALLLVGLVGVSSAAGKLAFDSLVQRDARASDKGRVLAQFEARFQMLWVVGAFIPVVIPLPARIGFLLIGLLAAAASLSYMVLRQPLGAVVGQMSRGRAARTVATRPAPPNGPAQARGASQARGPAQARGASQANGSGQPSGVTPIMPTDEPWRRP
ncbi:MAG: hypothetical protein QOJ19_3230 [Acidimicrobiia bacterium]|nr:hypothetical protein [Acidimicrobiia bacterium]